MMKIKRYILIITVLMGTTLYAQDAIEKALENYANKAQILEEKRNDRIKTLDEEHIKVHITLAKKQRLDYLKIKSHEEKKGNLEGALAAEKAIKELEQFITGLTKRDPEFIKEIIPSKVEPKPEPEPEPEPKPDPNPNEKKPAGNIQFTAIYHSVFDKAPSGPAKLINGQWLEKEQGLVFKGKGGLAIAPLITPPIGLIAAQMVVMQPKAILLDSKDSAFRVAVDENLQVHAAWAGSNLINTGLTIELKKPFLLSFGWVTNGTAVVRINKREFVYNKTIKVAPQNVIVGGDFHGFIAELGIHSGVVKQQAVANNQNMPEGDIIYKNNFNEAPEGPQPIRFNKIRHATVNGPPKGVAGVTFKGAFLGIPKSMIKRSGLITFQFYVEKLFNGNGDFIICDDDEFAVKITEENLLMIRWGGKDYEEVGKIQLKRFYQLGIHWNIHKKSVVFFNGKRRVLNQKAIKSPGNVQIGNDVFCLINDLKVYQTPR